ncbi:MULTISPECIES: class I SAM-dependent methyltransferase [Kribbella]|uniref:Class I SAM-dependent methyltransferase n=1 Tax=Kribbella karoonensis TaxID=324851 RepID=A0ABN2ELN5_9ACTN
MDREYALSSATDLGRRQLDYLEALLDARTKRCLEEVGLQPGMRCLDVGAGGGSITRWIADQVAPDGSVVAVDLDTNWMTGLDDYPGVEVYRHDINTGLPVEGRFDLIHVRLVLMHLEHRRDVLRRLVTALAPGGAVVVGDFTGPRQRVLAAPSAADQQLYLRVQEIAHAYVAREYPISYTWADEIDESLTGAGLIDVRGTEFSFTATGGEVACLLNRNYVQQLEDRLIAKSELTRADLDRYGDLMLDPRFRAWFYTFVCGAGRRPVVRRAKAL